MACFTNLHMRILLGFHEVALTCKMVQIWLPCCTFGAILHRRPALYVFRICAIVALGEFKPVLKEHTRKGVSCVRSNFLVQSKL